MAEELMESAEFAWRGANYSVLINGLMSGPHGLSTLSMLLKSGKLEGATAFRREGSEDWRPMQELLDEIEAFRFATQSQSTPAIPPAILTQNAKAAGVPCAGRADILDLGAFLFIMAGILGLLWFFLSNTTVGTAVGSVNNIGLLNTRECGMIGSGALLVFGGTLFIAAEVRRLRR